MKKNNLNYHKINTNISWDQNICWLSDNKSVDSDKDKEGYKWVDDDGDDHTDSDDDSDDNNNKKDNHNGDNAKDWLIIQNHIPSISLLKTTTITRQQGFYSPNDLCTNTLQPPNQPNKHPECAISHTEAAFLCNLAMGTMEGPLPFYQRMLAVSGIKPAASLTLTCNKKIQL